MAKEYNKRIMKRGTNMAESNDKALLRAGFNLHNAFSNLLNLIKQDPTNWANYIDEQIEDLSRLIYDYHKVAIRITEYTRKNGLPDYLAKSNHLSLELMDKFNDEIIAFNDLIDFGTQPKTFTQLIDAVNDANGVMLQIKLNH